MVFPPSVFAGFRRRQPLAPHFIPSSTFFQPLSLFQHSLVIAVVIRVHLRLMAYSFPDFARIHCANKEVIPSQRSFSPSSSYLFALVCPCWFCAVRGLSTAANKVINDTDSVVVL